MIDVLRKFGDPERLEPHVPRHALFQLPQFRPRQHGLEARLADEHDLQQCTAGVVHVRDEPQLLQHVRLEVLRLVDHEHRVRMQWHERQQEFLERMNQLVTRGRRQPRAIFRDDAEVLEHLFQQVITFEHRVVDD